MSSRYYLRAYQAAGKKFVVDQQMREVRIKDGDTTMIFGYSDPTELATTFQKIAAGLMTCQMRLDTGDGGGLCEKQGKLIPWKYYPGVRLSPPGCVDVFCDQHAEIMDRKLAALRNWREGESPIVF